MKNIVTIDFDIIMAPSINLYNHMIGNTNWNNAFMDDPQLALSRGDYAQYVQLTNWVMNVAQKMNPSQIHFIHSHEHVMNFIPEGDEELSIINIDHHHDISYNDKDSTETIETLNCGNWVKYIAEHKNLARYIWLNNTNSTEPHEATKSILSTSCALQNYYLTTLSAPDILIICLSEEWVPPTIRPLFFLWMDLLNGYYNCHFDFED